MNGGRERRQGSGFSISLAEDGYRRGHNERERVLENRLPYLVMGGWAGVRGIEKRDWGSRRGPRGKNLQYLDFGERRRGVT